MKKTKKALKKSGHKTVRPVKAARPKTAKKRTPKTVKKAPAKAGKSRNFKTAAEAFSKAELAGIKARLAELRDDLAQTVEDKKIHDMTEPEVGDSIDQAAQSQDKEILFELSDNERTQLDSIDAALRKMENGTYGVCEHCKTRIEKKRVKALPSARYCLPCQTGSEKSRM